jgi:hypothetical protein
VFLNFVNVTFLQSMSYKYVFTLVLLRGWSDGSTSGKAKTKLDGDGPCFVSNMYSCADLASTTSQRVASTLLEKKKSSQDGFPFVKKWIDIMTARKVVAEELAYPN